MNTPVKQTKANRVKAVKVAVPHDPSVLVKGRYEMNNLPKGKHKGLCAIVTGPGTQPDIFYKTEDGRIYWNGRARKDLVLHPDYFSAKDLATIHQLGGPAPQEIKRARKEVADLKASDSLAEAAAVFTELAQSLGIKSYVDKDGKILKIPMRTKRLKA